MTTKRSKPGKKKSPAKQRLEVLKRQMIDHLKSDICFRIRPSPIHGVGIFAIKNIPKGADPFKVLKKIKWVEFKRSELTNLPAEVQKIIDDFYTIEDTVWLPENGLNVFDISYFINHSDKPNLKSPDGGEEFMAARNIKAGEELTADYTTYHTH